jgi:mycofactocin system glycosyltransferase
VIALPEGFGLRLSRSVRRYRHGRVLVGGTPFRVMRLSDAGLAALNTMQAGREAGAEARGLGGRLIGAGLAFPVPGRGVPVPGVTVVIPARDRLADLEACVRSAAQGDPVMVVDDGSREPWAIEALCHRHGAAYLRRQDCGGPGAARNTALATIDTELVAFLDSDCTAPEGWLARLGQHFADPGVGAVAPRVAPAAVGGNTQGWRERYAAARSPLDLGPESADVAPGRPVAYVPAAALVVRTHAVSQGFAAELRYGEDIDLVWRLQEAEWTVRYDPAVVVGHREPGSWSGLLVRRYRYGTSAAPLSNRHPGRLVSAIVAPRPTAAVALALAGRPGPALAMAFSAPLAAAGRLRRAGLPPHAMPALGLRATWRTLLGLSRATTTLAGPILVAGLTAKRTRLAAGVLLAVGPIAEWAAIRPALDPLRWTAAAIADDAAYGAGVWRGCLRERTTRPLRPRFARTVVRI